MRSDIALEALPQGWQVYFGRQWTGDFLRGDYGLVGILERCVLEHLTAIQAQGLRVVDYLHAPMVLNV